MKGISILGLFGILLLVMCGTSFAVVNAFWVSPTPANNTDYYNSDFTMIMNASSAMNITGNFIEIDGTNHTCSLTSSNLSCIYTMNYSEKVYDNIYTIKGFANVSNVTYQTNETRIIPYVGCGQINGSNTLSYSVGSTVLNDSYCFEIIDNDTTIDCANLDITLESDSSWDAIYAKDKTGIVIRNCHFEKGYRAIYFDNVNYSTITNNLFNNQTYDVILFDFSDYSNITYNVFNMDYISNNDIYGFNCAEDCNGLNFFYNNMSNGEIGINTEGNDTSIWRNRIYNIDETGISIDGAPLGDGNTVSDNEIYGCDLGISSENMNTSVFAYNHMYNNSVSMSFVNYQDVNITHMMIIEEFDRPAGGYVNYSVISLLDVMLPNSAYNLDWSAVTVTPTGRESFLGKHISVSAAPEGVNYNETLIDVIGFTWTNGELVGYDESQIELWGIDVNGTAVLLNDTPNTGTNSIAIYNFRMEDYDSIGLYYHGSSQNIIPNVPGNVSNSEALTISNNIVIFGVLFMILFMIVGSFGLSKFYNFNELFVPLMVMVFLVILAVGLFL